MVFIFFFKQKTAYEMRISDWSSDVCSSDLSRLRSMRTGREEGLFTTGCGHDDPPCREAMGRWQPVGLTEGLWREVAAPPSRPTGAVPLPTASPQGGFGWQHSTPQPT